MPLDDQIAAWVNPQVLQKCVGACTRMRGGVTRSLEKRRIGSFGQPYTLRHEIMRMASEADRVREHESKRCAASLVIKFYAQTCNPPSSELGVGATSHAQLPLGDFGAVLQCSSCAVVRRFARKLDLCSSSDSSSFQLMLGTPNDL